MEILPPSGFLAPLREMCSVLAKAQTTKDESRKESPS
jgi:hypothetical protein